jgi:hypothetical protein
MHDINLGIRMSAVMCYSSPLYMIVVTLCRIGFWNWKKHYEGQCGSPSKLDNR